MRVIVELVQRADDLPLLRMYVHGAPHRRQHVAVIQRYREEIVAAARAAAITVPINHPVALWILFVDPCSPDFDNLLAATYQALDGSTLKGPALLADDGLVEVVERLARYFPNPVNKSDAQVRKAQRHRRVAQPNRAPASEAGG